MNGSALTLSRVMDVWQKRNAIRPIDWFFFISKKTEHSRRTTGQKLVYWYYFKSNGKVARKEWIENKYYVLDNGKMATGTHIIDHYQYVFDWSGNILSKKAVDIGWVEKDGKRYFYNGASQRLGDETTKKVMDISEHQGHISNWEGIIRTMISMRLLFVSVTLVLKINISPTTLAS